MLNLVRTARGAVPQEHGEEFGSDAPSLVEGVDHVVVEV